MTEDALRDQALDLSRTGEVVERWPKAAREIFFFNPISRRTDANGFLRHDSERKRSSSGVGEARKQLLERELAGRRSPMRAGGEGAYHARRRFL